MFIFRDPFRLDKPEPLDPVQAELERRILFAPPGHPGPFPTYDEVRAELDDRVARGAASARALMLAEAGFGPGVRVIVVRDLDGGIDRIEPFGKTIPTPPQSDEAEDFQPLGGAENGPENVECDPKHTAGEVLRNSAATDAEIVEVLDAASPPSDGVVSVPSFIIGRGETSPQHQRKLQRPRRQSKAIPASLSETGLKPKIKLKADSISKAKATARARDRVKAAAKAKANRKPKRERKKTISPDERALAERCFFMAEALGCPFNMKADLNPGHLDDLSVERRIAFCLKIVGNLLAYARRRCEARGMPYSWWPPVWAWVRESNPWTNLKEHVHFVFYAPEDERQRMVDLMEEKRKSTDPKVKRWCPNAKFALIDSFEHWTGSKFESALGYFVKMAHPNDYYPDSTIWYKKSGFIAGPRIKFSPFLLDPDRVEAHRIDVQALRRVRDGNRVIMRANGSKPARDPRSLSRARRPEPIIAIEPAMAVEPAPTPIEPDTCLTPVSIGHVHRGEAERFDMDLVDIETRPATAAIEPIPAAIDAAPAIPAAVEARVHAEDAAPPLSAITPAVNLAEAPPVPAFITPATPILAAAISAAAEPGPPPSSRNAPRLAPLVAFGRSISRGTRAAAGWISSMLFESPGFAAAGVFLGAPDVQPDPW